MAESPASQRRTDLIRQMARDLQKSRPMSISSRVSDTASNIDNQSTTSEFNPSASGLGSTRNMDEESQQLPQQQFNAQEYHPRPLAPNAGYKIDTSALGRAFPNFSRSGSERDDDSSRSIEIGRGYQNRSGINDGRSSHGLGDNPNPSLREPTSKKEDTSLKRVLEARRRSLEKETSRGSPPTVKATDYVSSGSRQSGRDEVPLQELDEENFTQFSDDRPPTVNITSQSSRFGTTTDKQGPASGNLPKNFTSSKDFLKNLGSKQGSKASGKQPQPNNATITSTFQSTMQSHALPDMPTISELVSGTFEDGTPIFSRTANARAASGSTRLASMQQGRKSRFGHYPIGEMAVPEEEEAIYVSLQLLQEKIAGLEVNRSEQEAQIQNLQDKNKILEAEKVERKRMSSRDSGIGQTSGSDADDDFSRKSRKTIIERTRLETTVRTLQDKLDVATKKANISGITIKKVASERESAISQLGMAYVTMEQLKVDKEALEAENEALKAELFASRNPSSRYVSDATTMGGVYTRNGLEREASRESGPTSRQDYTQLLDIDANPTHEAQSSKNNASTVGLPKEGAKNDVERRRKTRVVLEEYSETEHSAEEVSEDMSKPQYQSKSIAQEVLTNKARLTGQDTIMSAAGSGRFADVRRVLEEVSKDTSKSKHQSKSIAQEVPTNKACLTGQDTIMSATGSDRFVGVRRVLEEQRNKHKPQSEYSQAASADVRRVLEEQRLKPRTQIEYSQNFHEGAATSQQQHEPEEASVEVKLPKKSSMKNLKERSKGTTQETFQSQKESRFTTQSKASAKDSRPDMISNGRRSKHKRENAEEWTSGFIVPDITIRNPGEAAIKLSQSASEVFNQLAQHDGHNCSICKRVIEYGIPHEHGSATKLTVPKPTPVSDRMPLPEPDDDEPTMRPSQPPALALAMVLKELEDELKHSKIKLSEYQALYNSHDPALSKRKRKAVFDRIEKLLATIDSKADQIYSLYDVLEGQKQSGQEMDEDEVEITLLSIGINPNDVSMRGGNITGDAGSDSGSSRASMGQKESVRAPAEKSTSKRPAVTTKSTRKVKQVWDLESDDEEELPWEGFDATGELTGRSGRSGSSKRRA